MFPETYGTKKSYYRQNNSSSVNKLSSWYDEDDDYFETKSHAKNVSNSIKNIIRIKQPKTLNIYEIKNKRLKYHTFLKYKLIFLNSNTSIPIGVFEFFAFHKKASSDFIFFNISQLLNHKFSSQYSVLINALFSACDSLFVI